MESVREKTRNEGRRRRRRWWWWKLGKRKGKKKQSAPFFCSESERYKGTTFVPACPAASKRWTLSSSSSSSTSEKKKTNGRRWRRWDKTREKPETRWRIRPVAFGLLSSSTWPSTFLFFSLFLHHHHLLLLLLLLLSSFISLTGFPVVLTGIYLVFFWKSATDFPEEVAPICCFFSIDIPFLQEKKMEFA